jgi:hypothetical protein
MTELLKKIVTLRLEDRVGMAQNIVLEPDDPRRISAVLAPVPPPLTHEIVLVKFLFHACQYNIYIIVIDMEGNIRICRLPKGHGTEQ